MSRAGLPYSRDQVVNLERASRRSTITQGEIIVFAAVLGVPPVFLLAPVGDADAVEYLPGRFTDAWHAYKWIAGLGAEELLADADPEVFTRQHDDVALKLNDFRNHDIAVLDYSTALVELRSADPDEAEFAQRAAADKLTILLRSRELIRVRGWTPPLLPPDIRADVEQAEKVAGG